MLGQHAKLYLILEVSVRLQQVRDKRNEVVIVILVVECYETADFCCILLDLEDKLIELEDRQSSCYHKGAITEPYFSVPQKSDHLTYVLIVKRMRHDVGKLSREGFNSLHAKMKRGLHQFYGHKRLVLLMGCWKLHNVIAL